MRGAQAIRRQRPNRVHVGAQGPRTIFFSSKHHHHHPNPTHTPLHLHPSNPPTPPAPPCLPPLTTPRLRPHAAAQVPVAACTHPLQHSRRHQHQRLQPESGHTGCPAEQCTGQLPPQPGHCPRCCCCCCCHWSQSTHQGSMQRHLDGSTTRPHGPGKDPPDTGTQVHRFTGSQVHRFTGSQAHRHAGTQACRYTGIQVYRHAGVRGMELNAGKTKDGVGPHPHAHAHTPPPRSHSAVLC